MALVASPGAQGADLVPVKAEPVFKATPTVIPSDELVESTAPGVPTTRKRILPPSPPMDCSPAPKSSGSTTDPKLPLDPNATDQRPDTFAGAGEAGTQPAAQFDARMFGDQFGTYALTFRRQTVIPRQLIVPQQTIIQQPVVSTRSVTDTVTQSAAPAIFSNSPGFSNTTPVTFTFTNSPGAQIFGQGIPGTPVFNASGAVLGVPPQIALLENPTITTLAATLALPGEQVFFNSGVANTSNLGSGSFDSTINQTYDYVLTQFVSVVVPGTPLIVPLAPLITQQSFVAFLPLPSGGGVVGLTKLVDGNSPIPRDRLIFDFDYFANVPLTVNGFDVYRFSPGIEKTFFDGRTSVEVRAPFASTLDSSLQDGISNRATAFGDVHFTFKGLFYSSEQVNLATGFGLTLPTGYDTQLRLSDGTDLIRIKNRSVLIAPYLAALFTPTERLYIQTWGQVGFDANGCPVFVNPDLNGLYQAGRLRSQTLLQLDTQVGYWLKQDKTGQDFFTGLATFFELHYTTTLDNAGSVQAGNLSITSTNNRFDELNLTTGLNAIIQERLSAMVGVVIPLKSGGDRFFDYQVGVRLNYFFGADPSPRTYATNY